MEGRLARNELLPFVKTERLPLLRLLGEKLIEQSL